MTWGGLRYNGKRKAAGAQTVRPGTAKAGEGFAWRRDLTGRLSRLRNDCSSTLRFVHDERDPSGQNAYFLSIWMLFVPMARSYGTRFVTVKSLMHTLPVRSPRLNWIVFRNARSFAWNL